MSAVRSESVGSFGEKDVDGSRILFRAAFALSPVWVLKGLRPNIGSVLIRSGGC